MLCNKTAEELRWEARDDARTLARAEEIKADKERHARAIEGAKEIAKEETDRVKGIFKIAGARSPKVPTEKTGDVISDGKISKRNPATIGRL